MLTFVTNLFFNFIIFLFGIVFIFLSSINLITSFFSLKKERYESFFPRVSVLVRTWNDGSVVERCIKNYLKQDYPENDYEIIIMDDGSTDNTKEICEKYSKEGKIKYIRFEEHSELKAKVVDHTIENYATGEIIIETDVDGVLQKDFIKKMVRPYKDKEVAAVTGVVMGGNWYRNLLAMSRAVENFWHFCTAMYGRYALTGQGFIYGGSKSYRRKTWEELGGHSTKTLVEDGEMGAELVGKNKKIAIVKDSPVLQEEVETMKQYFDEQKRWIGGDIEVTKLYRKKLLKNKFNFIVMSSNFSIDFIFLASIIISFFNPIFIIFALINALAVFIGLFSFRAKREFYFYSIPCMLINSILRIIILLSLVKSKIKKDEVTWKKVWHYPVELKSPTKNK